MRRSLSFGSVSAGRLSGGALLRQVALLALLLVTVGFWIYFSVAASGFTSDFNLFSLLRFAAIQITIGFAQMVALSIGDLNLAVGAIGGATGMIAGWAMQFLGLPPLVAVLFALAAGTLLGFGNALLITWTRINSFIVTLATASLITGAMLILTHSDPFSRLPDSFTSFSETEVAGLPVSNRLAWLSSSSTATSAWAARCLRSGPTGGPPACRDSPSIAWCCSPTAFPEAWPPPRV